jgi:threonine dehydrogenase-like Zn-dependent dehydrogenase
MEAAIPQVLSGQITPGRVFDRTIALTDVPSGYKAMDDREALKVMVTV